MFEYIIARIFLSSNVFTISNGKCKRDRIENGGDKTHTLFSETKKTPKGVISEEF